ncbi:N-acetylmuramoyl-L-alanine amidase [Brevibacillus sp. SYSU BS000544]|uniref:N-acetylmuramoyl-L-alanine amidase n=1 Tax=Brevibacillus sp. SYSU BS000544 TaxID=3416443 RepID=UPI003CE55736
MRQRYIGVFVLLFMMLWIPSFVSAASSSTEDVVNLVIEGEQVQADVPPVIKNGRTLVPVRVIAEKMGADVSWDQTTQTAVINHEQQTIKLQLNSKKAIVNNKAIQLDTPPQLIHQRMLLPLRFVGEALGSTVGWDDRSRTVIANQKVKVHINGQDLTGSLATYKLDGTLFLPVKATLQKLGVAFDENAVSSGKMIDSQTVVPLADLEKVLDSPIIWSDEENQLVVEHFQEFEGYTVVDDHKVILHTSKPVTPQHFTMQGPHRLVIDLPGTKLSEHVKEEQIGGSSSEDGVDEDSNGSNEPNEEVEDNSWLGIPNDIPIEIPAVEETRAQTGAEVPLIQSIRYSQYSDSPYTVRVVVELSQKSKYTFTADQNDLQFELTAVPRKTGYLVVVDAGHGGKDPGAKGVAGNLEKDFNLRVANKLVEILSKDKRFQVVATRSTDEFIELKDRAGIANEMEADLFISIHANSFKPTTRGTETFYFHEKSKAFAQVVHRHLVKATAFPDRGVQTAAFVVIKQTTMPAVLTETGFLTNSIENSKLVSPEFQTKVAEALADAIREYYQSYQ